MSSFGQFYSDGGFFMHAVSIAGAAATYYTVKAIVLHKKGDQAGGDAAFDATLKFAGGLLLICVALGVEGTLMGLFETGAVVQHAPPEHQVRALARGMAIASSTTNFALMIAIPVGLAQQIVRFRRGRARAKG